MTDAERKAARIEDLKELIPFPAGHEHEFLASIAISLKRIADLLEKIASEHWL